VKRRRPRGTKVKAQRRHARGRGMQRYGLENADVKAIEAKIRAGSSRCVYRQSIRVTHHEVDYNDRVVIAVYDSSRHQVVTFLYPEEP
jgi:hypothetical protein